MEGLIYKEKFIEDSHELLRYLTSNVNWDNRMSTRKTASYGKAYNYSQIFYPYQEFPLEIEAINRNLISIIGFEPNNCLLNYYPDGNSKMGYHSDQIDILEVGTGIAIVSVGATRTLKFKNITNPTNTYSYELISGSLIYMSQKIQKEWQHAIPKSDTTEGRISLTFRQML